MTQATHLNSTPMVRVFFKVSPIDFSCAQISRFRIWKNYKKKLKTRNGSSYFVVRITSDALEVTPGSPVTSDLELEVTVGRGVTGRGHLA